MCFFTTTKTLKKIGKTIGVFFRSVVVYSIAVPILFTILSVLCGILLPFVSLSVFILLFSSEGRKYLGQHSTQVNKLTNWQCFCLFAIATIVSPTPVLFVLSLILHWHLAATIALGIVVSLSVIVVAICSTLRYLKKEEEPLKEDTGIDTGTEFPIDNIQRGDLVKNRNYRFFVEEEPHEKGANTNINSLDNENNIKRCNSFSEKILKSDFCNNFFQKGQNENNDSCKSLPLVKGGECL